MVIKPIIIGQIKLDIKTDNPYCIAEIQRLTKNNRNPISIKATKAMKGKLKILSEGISKISDSTKPKIIVKNKKNTIAIKLLVNSILYFEK